MLLTVKLSILIWFSGYFDPKAAHSAAYNRPVASRVKAAGKLEENKQHAYLSYRLTSSEINRCDLQQEWEIGNMK